MIQTRIFIALLLTCTIALFSCNNRESKTTQQPTTTDLQRDGLKGSVKTYTHEEYAAIQRGTEWVKANDTALVRTVYSYDSLGTLLKATDIIMNGLPADIKRVYKHAEGQPVTAIRYDQGMPISHTTRQWTGTNSYTETTFRNFNKNDTTNWESRQQVQLNANQLLDKYTYELRTGDSIIKASSQVYYNADNSIRAKVFYNAPGDSTVINYQQLSKDGKGNPLKTLKQYATSNRNILILESYEYY